MEFEEFAPFSKRLAALLSDEDHSQFQVFLLERPDAGKVILKSGGLRKISCAAKGHGKRSGARVIYYWLVNRDKILLLDIYAKNEKENLSPMEIQKLKQLIKEYLL